MPDVQQNITKYHKYRYSILELIGLSATACLPFDLAKFSYDAARAGVVPSLSDCVIASRKSSASCPKGYTMDTASTEDLVVFQGNRVLRPDRQPNLPPPTERQKDEGFARFLKKHSSPTHNRVTAGGRIVPMEPRSPPAFNLPSNVTDQASRPSADQDIQRAKLNGDNGWDYASRKGNEYGINSTNMMSAEPQLYDVALRNGALDFSMSQIPAYNADHLYGSPYSTHIPLNGSAAPVSITSPSQLQCSAQHIGGPVIQPSSYNHQSGVGSYQSHPNMASAMSIQYGNHYAGTPAWNLYTQSLGYQMPLHQTMSAQQQLAAWEQHYADLDLQLKNIDRHRAMHHLDPYLSEQRRVIVQQRSDAKDTIREYQNMLGLKRMTDSSQESFATGFNVDAPVYVPAKELSKIDILPRQGSLPTMPEEPFVFKPKGSTGRKAIPIKPPPDASRGNNEPFVPEAQDFDEKGSVEVDEWGVQTRNAPPEIKRQQSEMSAMIEAELKRRKSSKEELSLEMSNSQPSAQFPDQAASDGFRGSDDVDTPPTRVTSIIPPLDNVPLNRGDELQQIADAISRPKGTTTKVRLLDNRVIDVGGQGLQIPSSPLPDGTWDQNRHFGHGSLRVGALGKRQFTRKSSIPFDEVAVTNSFANKENVSVTPRGHQKAATDAFLSQFNTVGDSMALTVKPETQSLRNTWNGHVDDDKYKLHSYLQPGLISQARGVQMQLPNSFNQEQYVVNKQDSGFAAIAAPMSPDDLNHKGYSSVSIQNVHAIGRLPHNFDGSVDARQSAQAQLVAAEKARSPRLLRRHGINGGAWYGPHCREVFERALLQNKSSRSARPYLP